MSGEWWRIAFDVGWPSLVLGVVVACVASVNMPPWLIGLGAGLWMLVFGLAAWVEGGFEVWREIYAEKDALDETEGWLM